MLGSASVVGRQHRIMQQNCHDYAISGRASATEAAFGLVLDGCGSKYQAGQQRYPAHSEVGAKLLGSFAAAWLQAWLARPENAGRPETLPAALHASCLGYLRRIVAPYPEAAWPHFVATHLLATFLGFAVTPQAAVFFWCGDGYLCHDGAVTCLESDNRPDYLAYRLLRPEMGAAFQVRTLPREGVSWLAVASDGWRPEQLAALPRPDSPLALQRWLNVQARQRGTFGDDGAVAAWWQ